jgi:arylsulfatase A-like enzyme
MDDAIGLILDAIEPYSHDTIVIYTSDQGYFLGEVH